MDCFFKNITFAIRCCNNLFAFFHICAKTCFGKKSTDTGTAVTHLFNETAHWEEFNFQFAFCKQLLGNRVCTDMGCDHFVNLAIFNQTTDCETWVACINRADCKVLNTAFFKHIKKIPRHVSTGLTTNGDCLTILETSHDFFSCSDFSSFDFHLMSLLPVFQKFMLYFYMFLPNIAYQLQTLCLTAFVFFILAYKQKTVK